MPVTHPFGDRARGCLKRCIIACLVVLNYKMHDMIQLIIALSCGPNKLFGKFNQLTHTNIYSLWENPANDIKSIDCKNILFF